MLPGAFKVMVKNGFSKTVEDTSRDDIGLDALLFKVKNAVLNLLDLRILSAGLSLLVVALSEGMMDVSLSLCAFHFRSRLGLFHLDLLFCVLGFTLTFALFFGGFDIFAR